MAGYYQPLPSDHYQGLPHLFGYDNHDGLLVGTNCGQAASATLLTFLGKMPIAPSSTPHANPNMLALEASFPPNILGGLAGTSRGRVERILEAHGTDTIEIDGEQALRYSVRNAQPVAVMLQVPGKTMMGITWPAGHWMVVYGYDCDKVYLSNWDIEGMPWEQFRQGWSHLFPWCINMNRKGLLARPAL